jgi:hypothetical protein
MSGVHAERVIKNSIQLSTRLISGIEADLRDVHEMISSSDRDSGDREKLYTAMRLENIEMRV